MPLGADVCYACCVMFCALRFMKICLSTVSIHASIVSMGFKAWVGERNQEENSTPGVQPNVLRTQASSRSHADRKI